MFPMHMPRVLALLTALATLVSGAESFAQDLELNRWRPATSLRYDFITLDSSRADLARGYELGLWFQYANDPLIGTIDEDQVDKLVSGQVVAHVAAAFEFADRIRLSLDLPAYLVQTSEDPLPGRDLEGGGIGDIGITPKIEIYDGRSGGRAGVGVAVLAPLLLPTGDGDRLQGQSFRATPTLVIDYGTPTGFTVGANIGATIGEDVSLINVNSNETLNWGVGIEIPLGSPDLDLLAELEGGVPLSGGSSEEVPMEAMGMLRAGLGPMVAGIGGGAGLMEGWGAPDFRVFGMLGYSPEPRAPRTPEVPEPVVQVELPPSDRDGDGYIDEEDGCPDDPEDFDQLEDEDGCPEDDVDGDGILDVDDACPTEPEDIEGWQDADGCPDPDNDQDRILDGDDQCPAVDGDAMEDVQEVYNEFEDDDGCPDALAELTETHIQLNGIIYFDLDSDVIQQRSFAIVDEVARILEENPTITLIEVQGHTDVRATDDYNDDLSQRRTESVVRALRDRGIDRDRLQARGFGERQLADHGTTDAAHQRNRRVEFQILEREEPEPEPAPMTDGSENE